MAILRNILIIIIFAVHAQAYAFCILGIGNSCYPEWPSDKDVVKNAVNLIKESVEKDGWTIRTDGNYLLIGRDYFVNPNDLKELDRDRRNKNYKYMYRAMSEYDILVNIKKLEVKREENAQKLLEVIMGSGNCVDAVENYLKNMDRIGMRKPDFYDFGFGHRLGEKCIKLQGWLRNGVISNVTINTVLGDPYVGWDMEKKLRSRERIWGIVWNYPTENFRFNIPVVDQNELLSSIPFVEIKKINVTDKYTEPSGGGIQYKALVVVDIRLNKIGRANSNDGDMKEKDYITSNIEIQAVYNLTSAGWKFDGVRRILN